MNGRRDDSSARWNAALPPDICAFADRVVSPRPRRSTFSAVFGQTYPCNPWFSVLLACPNRFECALL